MQLWLMRLTSGRDRSTPDHIMLGEEESDKEKELGNSGGGGGGGGTLTKSLRVSRPSRSHAFLADDTDGAGECTIGGTVLSSYCCVVLLIFAFLFILIGSILTHMYYFAQQSDAEVGQFLHKHEYLKVFSPFVICLGVAMLVAGVAFLIVRRCRRPSLVRYVESPNDSYFPPDDDGRLRGSSTLVGCGRNSLTSAISSHAVSPLLAAPSSATSGGEWRWPATATTPQGSVTPRIPSANGRSPTPLDPPDSERRTSPPALAIPVETIPTVITIPVTSEQMSSTTLASNC